MKIVNIFTHQLQNKKYFLIIILFLLLTLLLFILYISLRTKTTDIKKQEGQSSLDSSLNDDSINTEEKGFIPPAFILTPIPTIDLENIPPDKKIKAGTVEEFFRNLKTVPDDTFFIFEDDNPLTKEEILKNWNKALEMVPTNPNTVVVTCKSTGEKIISGKATSCKDPVFVWNGAQVKEPGAKIIGYYVYLGKSNNTTLFGETGFENAIDPVSVGNFVGVNTLGPEKLEYLQADGPYYLIIRTKTDSKINYWSYGLDILDKENYKVRLADVLFEYKYEK